jgi:hypothetical protein
MREPSHLTWKATTSVAPEAAADLWSALGQMRTLWKY